MTKNRTFSLLVLLALTSILAAQVPFAFRYQASIRNDKNRPINEEVVFEIQLYSDLNGLNQLYSEEHTIEPDTNGLVAFSIGEGVTTDDFSSIIWAEGPFYIKISLDNEEVSYSQLVSVPYAMHAQTADKIHDLQDPVFGNDATTKNYVDKAVEMAQDSANIAIAKSSKTTIETVLNASKQYADSLSITPKDVDIASTGDTLIIGSTKLVIPGMSSDNMSKYDQQLVLGGSYNESLVSAQFCKDSSLILLGVTLSGNGDVKDFKGDADIWLVKVNKQLQVEWTKTLGGSGYDNAKTLIIENDGYLIGGTTESSDGDISTNNGGFDIWLCKLNTNGTIAWENSYGGAGTEFLNTIVPITTGGYYIGATTFSNGGDISWQNGECDIWVFEINTSRAIEKSASIGGSKYDALSSLTVNEDNTISILGTTASNDGDINQNNGALDFLSLKLDANLDIIEHNCYGEGSNEQLIKGNTTLLAGNVFADNWSISTGNALKNIRIQNIGDTPWATQLGGSASDVFIDFKTNNDTILILGQTSSFDGDITHSKGGEDIWLVQLLPNGEINKKKTLGGTYDETPKVLKKLSDGWLIGGESESSDADINNNAGDKDIWVIKLDKDLNITWQKTFGGSYSESLTDILVKSDTEFILTGTTASDDYSITGLHDKAGKSSDIWILNINIE